MDFCRAICRVRSIHICGRLYDALYQIMGSDSFLKNMEKGLIEVAPLAYMRGRTLDNAFIILDEAQNTSPAQMKMFLTRIGFGSKVVITGDQTQKDLPSRCTVRTGYGDEGARKGGGYFFLPADEQRRCPTSAGTEDRYRI